MKFTRRQLLAHSGALGLGLLLVPSLGTVARAEPNSIEASGTGAFAKGAFGEESSLVLETVEAGGLAHYSYFIADRAAGQAAVIDPRRDVDVYLELAERYEVEIVYSLETHIHADFLSGARELAARTGGASQIAASIEGGAQYGFRVDRELSHGDEIRIGEITLTALHTPGHTPEHLSFLASRAGLDSEPLGLFTGDFLFVRSIGRPDLMGVENTDRLAKLLYQTAQDGYRDLPDSLAIYPAHGPGSPCGAGIQGVTGQPTLGEERASNPYLNLKNEQTFIDTLLQAQPPVPYYWPRMKKLNAAGPELLKDRLQVRALPPKELASLIKGGGLQVLDTRQACAFAGGHIPGVLNIGYDPVISLWGGWVLDPERPLALVVPNEGRAEEVAAWLSRVGLEKNIVGAVSGGMKGWINEALPFENFPTMSVHQVKAAFPSDEFQLLDVRQPSEWDSGHLPGAQYIFLPELEKRQNELDRDRPIVLYCGNGYRASIGTSILRKLGFDARSVPGSYQAWTAAGYPVHTPKIRKRASLTTRP